MISTLFTLAHESTAVVYAIFAVLIFVRGTRSWLSGFLFAAIAATALWAQVSVAVIYELVPGWLEPLASGVRDAAWLGLCLGLMHRRGGYTTLWRGMVAASVALVILQIFLDVTGLDAGTFAGVRVDGALLRVATTILGLVLVENIFRNSSVAEFWSLKHLLIGLSCILGFQLVSGVPEFLTHARDLDIVIARPLVFLLAVPLFVVSSVRFPNLQLRVHSSRTFVFHSATLIMAGIMLQGVAAAAWYVRQYGGSNGTVLAVILLFAGAVGVATALVSGGVRSRMRKFVNENFFSLKYDYRVEWEKVIRGLTLNPEQDSAERALRTLCDLLDSPGGALWIHRASWHQFLPAAKLGFASEYLPIAENDPRIERLRESETAFVPIEDENDSAAEAAWRKNFSAEWIVVPLRYRSSIVGLAVLSKARAPKALDWEDQNLIRLVAMQIGAYLVQEETAQSLADARQLEDFNKRFAFVVHDIKNTIGQLSLLVRNAAQFGHKQEFRDDMVVTLANSVDRLQQLLMSLAAVGNQNVPGNRPVETIDLVTFISEFTKEKVKLGQHVVFVTDCPSLPIELTDISNLRRALEHVVANGVQASGPEAIVEVSVNAIPEAVEIKITDHGAGMTEKFITEELFRPMRTTKEGGFGIGAYQVRELIRDLGGDVSIASKMAQGTCVTLSLPRRDLVGTDAK